MKKICIECGGPVYFKYGATEMNDGHGNYTYRCWTCMRASVERKIEETRRAYGFQERTKDQR